MFLVRLELPYDDYDQDRAAAIRAVAGSHADKTAVGVMGTCQLTWRVEKFDQAIELKKELATQGAVSVREE